MGEEQNCGVYQKSNYLSRTLELYHLSENRERSEVMSTSDPRNPLHGCGPTKLNSGYSVDSHPPREQGEIPYQEECMDVTTEDGCYVNYGMDKKKGQQEYYHRDEEEEMRYVQKKYSNYSHLTYPKSTYSNHAYTSGYRAEFYSDGPYPTSMYANRVVGEGTYEASAQINQSMENEYQKEQVSKKAGTREAKHITTVWEMVSVISGILALISFPIWWLCPILALISIASGIVQIYKNHNRSMAFIGWTCSAFGVIFDGMLIVKIARMASSPEGRECLRQFLRYFGYDI